MIDMETKTTFPVYCTMNKSVVGAAAINPIPITGREIKVSNIAIIPNNCQNGADGELTITMSTQQDNYFYSIDNQPDKTDNTFTRLPSGSHTLRIKNQHGCYIDTVVNIPFLYDVCTDSLFVPGAFTPNGDGKNDVFRAIYYMRLSDFRMTIYNRNGQPIFNSQQIGQGWDGRYKQVLQPMDTYIWFIRYTNRDGKPVIRKGTVTLIR
jgi:gliding motility-associated-like protein